MAKIMSFGNRHNQHSFAKVPSVNIPRSQFDRSHAVKDTMMFDLLTPIFVDEVVPGDTCNLSVQSFFRLAPQVRPIMDNMYIDFFFFYVPTRLVWTNFQRFMGEQPNPGDSTDFLLPTLEKPPTGTILNGSMFDHFGIPADQPWPATGTICSLPFRAYNLIWNEWFRDENLQIRLTQNFGDGPDPVTNFVMRPRGKRHDYFTSMLPWPQKGGSVSLLEGGLHPVITNGQQIGLSSSPDNVDRLMLGRFVGSTNVLGASGASMSGDQTISFGDETGLQIDVDSFNSTINQFRQAIMMQSLLELDARGGTRYVELVKAHFGVNVPDFRVQRPEFLSGGTIKINQHPLAQTSETTAESPQANLAAFSTAQSTGSHIGFTKSIPEHGYIIGLASARADITYQQGLNRMWSRRTKYDMYWPKFQEIGEQAVLRQEIFMTDDDTNNKTIQGYQERFGEMRYKPSEIRGQFRTQYAESLDVWHLAEYYETAPLLNSFFISSNTPIERALILPDPLYPHLLCDYWFDYKHARPLVSYAVPAALGRF